MTPIKCFRRLGNLLFTEDWSGARILIGLAESNEQADWLATTLRLAHHRPVIGWDDEFKE